MKILATYASSLVSNFEREETASTYKTELNAELQPCVCLYRSLIFLLLSGRFLADMTKQVLSDLEASKYQVRLHLV